MKNRRNQYQKISDDKRLQIIERIMNQGHDVKEVSRDLHVNISTSKAIIKVFKDEGRVGKKEKRDKIVDVVETFSFYCVEDGVLREISPLRMEKSRVNIGYQENIQEKIKENCHIKAQKYAAEMQNNV